MSQAQINYQNITTIRGDGFLLHRGNAEVTGAVLLGPPMTSTTENEKNTNVRTHTQIPTHHVGIFSNFFVVLFLYFPCLQLRSNIDVFHPQSLFPKPPNFVLEEGQEPPSFHNLLTDPQLAARYPYHLLGYTSGQQVQYVCVCLVVRSVCICWVLFTILCTYTV